MNNINIDNVCFSDTAKFIKKGDKVVIGNIKNSGLWIKINYQDLKVIQKFVGQSNGFDLLMESVDEQYRGYFVKILNALAKIKVLERIGQKPDNGKIREISIELTTMCNLRCKHCSGEYGDKGKQTMPIEMFKKIIRWADKNNIELITLSGGEVFCIPDVIEYFKFARKWFRGTISIITNATLIRQEHISILQRCVDEISISLDGYDKKSVDFIRGAGVFERVINTIHMLKNNGIGNIAITMVLTSDNRNHILDFNDFCYGLGVKPLTRILSVKGRALQFYEDLVNDDERGKEDYITKKINMLSLCDAGRATISINSEGKVTMCAALEESNIVLGNVKELDTILNSVERINTECVVDMIEPCKLCDVRYFCSSVCQALNMNIYYNNELRERRCIQYKDILEKNVWGNNK